MDVDSKKWKLKKDGGIYYVRRLGTPQSRAITKGQPDPKIVALMSETRFDQLCAAAYSTGEWSN